MINITDLAIRINCLGIPCSEQELRLLSTGVFDFHAPLSKALNLHTVLVQKLLIEDRLLEYIDEAIAEAERQLETPQREATG